jgi:hypothetical protein
VEAQGWLDKRLTAARMRAMTPQTLTFIWSTAGGLGLGALVAFGIGYFILSSYIPGYLAEKGKNLASKEDIRELTEIVEDVKRTNAEVLEEQKAQHQAKNQLRFAALDKRLQAHQEAFTLLRKLVKDSHSESVINTVVECQTWWEGNCLYLEPAAREAFSGAYNSAASHKSFLDASRFGGANQQNIKGITDNWDRIIGAFDVMVAAVALPSLNAEERKGLAAQEPKG